MNHYEQIHMGNIVMNEPETFDWKIAARLFSENADLEVCYKNKWLGIDAFSSDVCFERDLLYRRKPLPEIMNNINELKRGDQIYVSDDEQNWVMEYFHHVCEWKVYTCRHGDFIGGDIRSFDFWKPSPPPPDYTKDQNFKKGDIVMVSDDALTWKPCEYRRYFEYVSDKRHVTRDGGGYDYARTLSSEEYSRVKHV